ncbi:MAG: DUF4411 family protein [Anaerolineales bacterium]|nr:DUF4411 family protein [Anaerolineales bacterium]
MIYVIDTNSLNVLKNYYLEPFQSFWRDFNLLVEEGRLLSVREVYQELDGLVDAQHLQDWIRTNKDIFYPPQAEETEFMAQIFAVSHFRQLVPQKKTLTSNPFADPFVVASARVRNGCVVTEEKLRPNGAKIPNICEHFGIDWTNLEGLMKNENWRF